MDNDKQDAIKREMLRSSLDSIRVYNPTNKDYALVWDGFKHVVPARNRDVGYGEGQRVMARYLAEKYCREMKNQLINEQSEENIKSMISRASEDMKLKYQSDPYERQKLYEMTPRTDDPKEIKRIYEMIWLGVEEKYGIIDDEEPEENDGKVDTRTVEEQILASMNDPVKKETKQPASQAPTKAKEDLEKELL